MLMFPPRFIKVPRLPGYVWEQDEEILYSFKGGELKPLKYHEPCYFNKFHAGFQISHKGNQRYITVRYLKTLKQPDKEYVDEKRN